MKNITLVKIGAIGGILTCTMGMATIYKVNNNIKNSDFFRESMKLVRSNPAAVYLLGEPIKDLTIKIGDTRKNYERNGFFKYEIPLKGSKQRGILHLYVNKNKEKMDINKIELEVSQEADKRLKNQLARLD